MRQQYIRISAHVLYDLLGFKLDSVNSTIGKNARKFFAKFHCEPQFPSDAKIVKIVSQPSYDRYYFYIESQAYPDVFAPVELMLICYRDNIWEEPERVTFS
jgi:hypothetical protein